MNHIFICLLIILVLTCLENYLNAEHFTTNQNEDERWIVIEPMWGLCNRLRTLRIAYDLAKETGRKLAVIDDKETGEFKTMFHGQLKDLFTSPYLIFWSKKDLKDKKHYSLKYNIKNDCSYETTLTDFKKLSNKPIIVINACGLNVKGLQETNEFYKSIVPTEKVMSRISNNIEKIKSTSNIVGIHIRQGTIADYNKGNFFGKWEKDSNSNNIPIRCCGKETRNDPMCPQNAPSIDKFVEKMHTFPKEAMFFVCSDRPGCYFWLQEEFPNRIINNKVEIEYEANALNAFCDWYCLANCKEIIISTISSFSGEASKLNNANTITI